MSSCKRSIGAQKGGHTRRLGSALLPANVGSLLTAISRDRFPGMEINLTADILRITLDPEAGWDHTEGRGDEVLVDYDDQGLPIALELFGSAAQEPLTELVRVIDSHLGEEGVEGLRTVLARVLEPSGIMISDEDEDEASSPRAGATGRAAKRAKRSRKRVRSTKAKKQRLSAARSHRTADADPEEAEAEREVEV